MAKFASPNMPKISIYTFFHINLEHAVEISSWIDRRSRDGFDVKTFHRLCDYIPGLIVVIKVENSNEILGGYNPLCWKSTNNGWNGWLKAPGSFIFSLKNENMKESILSRVNDQSDAICYNQDYGPWFHSFGHYDPDGPKQWSYRSSNTYQPSIRNAANDKFFIDDYEVFQICKNV
ncbi:hypothetical protein C2G38_2114409 [Gigaspora rosea]|uniref:TLDc domain-containing protein n=1 Tax=Gigaspora rosea TaxID=44941 RepID=A0A397UAL0_9GLOM|nr:hypothetical protein C2G38_2114409 [Gigaspora rosea]